MVMNKTSITDGNNTLPKQRERTSLIRPASLYDNLRDETPRESPSRSLTGPSQESAMVTTVPQNIVAPKIEGRHAPTRTSLRHSRMIVLTKQGKVPKKYLPRVVHQHRLASSLLTLQLLMGIAISTIAVWLLIWAPNLLVRDRPYWSGIPVVFSAIVGLILLCSCRKEYPGMPVKYHIISCALSLVAVAASFSAAAFALIHLYKLNTMVCGPNSMSVSCVCRNDSEYYVYVDLSCIEVWNILSIILIASTATNIIAGVLSSWYVLLHCISSIRKPHAYTQVRTGDNRPIIITNNQR